MELLILSLLVYLLVGLVVTWPHRREIWEVSNEGRQLMSPESYYYTIFAISVAMWPILVYSKIKEQS